MDTIYLSFLWHMHQPYYKNLRTNEYLLPWVLLHATKDYYDMPYLLKDFNGLKQNFNLVPSLLLQLIDYEELDVQDKCVDIFKKKPKDLASYEKVYLLTNFFNANWDNMIKPFPRYFELLRKRGFYYAKEDINKIKSYFTDEDIRDIQVLFFISWIDPLFYEMYDSLKYLKSKGRGFSEDDKKIVTDIQKDILKNIIPLYRQLSKDGVVELSTSPFYHPIVPLLIDNRAALEAMPDVQLPEKIFSRPEDASVHIKTAKELFFRIFQLNSKGMWPPEGSVSDDAISLYMEHGIEWLAADEEIVFRSLGLECKKDGNGFLLNPDILYKPYVYEKDGKRISFVFRDKTLSDLISFHYSRFEPKDAARDLLNRLKDIRKSVSGRIKKPLVTIVMDGENAWESYRNDGRDFFQYLYEGLLNEQGIECPTISEYLEDAKDVGNFQHCFAGSWIAHNFSIWIGNVEDNASWSLLCETRDFLEKADPERKNKDAWESIYIAEGSDWNWWYGDEHASENDEIFDFLFRENLSNVYRFLGKEPPEKLNIPVIIEDREVRPEREPTSYLNPIIDGNITNYFEWIGSGLLEGKGHGVSMHDSISLIKNLYYGFNESFLYLRVDIDKSFMQEIEDMSFEIGLNVKKTYKITYETKNSKIKSPFPVEIIFSDVLEVEVPFEPLKVKAGDKIGVWVSLKKKEMIVGRIPGRGYLMITVPSETFEMEMWYI